MNVPTLLDRRPFLLAGLFLCAGGLLPSGEALAWQGKPNEGTLRLTIIDRDTRQRIPCRVHVQNQAGVARKALKMPFWHDHFACPGEVELKLPKGAHRFTIERGPEYVDVTGHFMIVDYGVDAQTVELRRAVNMAAEGWWSGDLYVERSPRDMELILQADDLHVAPVVTWSNQRNDWSAGRFPEETLVRCDGNRYYDLMAGKDERGGGRLLYFGLNRPLDWSGHAREYPASLDVIRQAKQAAPDVWVDAEKPTWWDFPIWLAAGAIDSIGVAHDHLLRSGMTKHEAWGRTRDRVRFPDPRGTGEWSLELYFHVLNCGLRIPPSAGSGSGKAANPIGYNRVYVHVEPHEFNVPRWWQNFRAGQVVVTNGPLIRPVANGELPGHVFTLPRGDSLEIDVAMNLATRDPIHYMEVIHNGRPIKTIRLEDWAATGHFPKFRVDGPGWFLVRAVTERQETYRFALSAPWYVEVAGEGPRVSRRSAQFFLDWLEERARQLPLADPQQRASVLETIDGARTFWQDQVNQASAD